MNEYFSRCTIIKDFQCISKVVPNLDDDVLLDLCDKVSHCISLFFSHNLTAINILCRVVNKQGDMSL